MQTKNGQFKISSLNDLAKIRAFLQESAVSLGADTEMAADLTLAANEAITNIFMHGFQQQTCDIDIQVRFNSPELSILIIDSGPPFDPTTVKNPKIDAPLEKRAPGGLGVLMIREFTNHFSYKRIKEEQNQLILKIGGTDGN